MLKLPPTNIQQSASAAQHGAVSRCIPPHVFLCHAFLVFFKSNEMIDFVISRAFNGFCLTCNNKHNTLLTCRVQFPVSVEQIDIRRNFLECLGFILFLR
jgi:hypothetical protein